MRLIFILTAISVMLFLGACKDGSTSKLLFPERPHVAGNLLDAGGLHSSGEQSGIGGAVVSLISVEDGSLLGRQTTAADGSFAFESIHPGLGLLTVDFHTDSDLGYGVVFGSELSFTRALQIEAGSLYHLTGILDVHNDFHNVDEIGIRFRTIVTDDTGSIEDESRLIIPEQQEVYMDTDGDGSYLDETAYVDADGDGLPDELVGHMNSLHGGMLKGPIEEITDADITVEGITFQITNATQWKDKGRLDSDMLGFELGVNILVRGFWNGRDWIALEVITTEILGVGADGGKDNGGGSDGGIIIYF